MVARTVDLPNIRKLFVPDAGYVIADCDLAGADAQVVAWEADDADLKQAFRAGINVHIKNARDMFPEKIRGWSDEAIHDDDQFGGVYYTIKRLVHASDNGGKPKSLAGIVGWLVSEVETFQRVWFGLHPGILAWHERLEEQLITTRTVSNAFGFRIVYFDRVESLAPGAAVAWVAQSTVALVTIAGAKNIKRNLSWVRLLLQVHDSLVLQYPMSMHSRRNEIREQLTVTVPYPDPLTIPWGLKTSTRSWGHCEDESWGTV